MIPLILSGSGEERIIIKIGGNPDLRKRLETLGFVTGAKVMLVNGNGGNVIVNIKDARVAISREAAQKIMV